MIMPTCIRIKGTKGRKLYQGPDNGWSGSIGWKFEETRRLNICA